MRQNDNMVWFSAVSRRYVAAQKFRKLLVDYRLNQYPVVAYWLSTAQDKHERYLNVLILAQRRQWLMTPYAQRLNRLVIDLYPHVVGDQLEDSAALDTRVAPVGTLAKPTTTLNLDWQDYRVQSASIRQSPSLRRDNPSLLFTGKYQLDRAVHVAAHESHNQAVTRSLLLCRALEGASNTPISPRALSIRQWLLAREQFLLCLEPINQYAAICGSVLAKFSALGRQVEALMLANNDALWGDAFQLNAIQPGGVLRDPVSFGSTLLVQEHALLQRYLNVGGRLLFTPEQQWQMRRFVFPEVSMSDVLPSAIDNPFPVERQISRYWHWLTTTAQILRLFMSQPDADISALHSEITGKGRRLLGCASMPSPLGLVTTVVLANRNKVLQGTFFYNAAVILRQEFQQLLLGANERQALMLDALYAPCFMR